MAIYKSEEIKAAAMTQTEFGKLVGLTQQRISQLLDEEILIRDETSRAGRVMLLDSLKNFWLSKKSTDDGINFWKERSLHERAKRELTELKLRERQGELYESETVERVLSELLTDFRNKLLGIGHKLSRQLEGLTAAQICDIIDGEIQDCMKELSEGVNKAKYAAAQENDSGASDAESEGAPVA